MKNRDEMKIVLIGMGYLMEYIAPCYQRLLGGRLWEQSKGVTADPVGLERKAQATGVPVVLNDNLGALRDVHPDIIFFAPPPSLAAQLTEQVLKVYYEEERAAGNPIPLLFAFPPNPEGAYYRRVLGADLKVANILPNMIREIAGKPSAAAGFTMVTLPEDHGWEKSELEFLEDFWSPLGQVVFLSPEEVKTALAVSCSNQMLTEALLDMEREMNANGISVSVSDLAQAARGYLMNKLGYYPPEPVESHEDAVDKELLEAVKKVTYHAYQGTTKFMTENGFEKEKAERIQRMNYDLNLRKAQLMTKADLRRATRNHATRGGVLECACISYTRNWQENVRQHFSGYPAWTPDADWAEKLEEGFVKMSQDVKEHLNQLAEKKEPGQCQIEHHAVLYALLEKEAVEQAGEEGRKAMYEATARYGRERGARMRQNAEKFGDEPNAFSYLAYGEWSAAPGAMIVDEYDTKNYTTHVKKCEWCRCWEKHGLLDYGKAYCTNVDVNIAHGFDPEFDLIVNSLMSAGDEVCEFGYGFEMTPEKREELAEIKEKIGQKAQKDFNYHCAHMWVSIRNTLTELLGEQLGHDITDAALFDFTRRFGSEYADAVLAGKDLNFSII